MQKGDSTKGWGDSALQLPHQCTFWGFKIRYTQLPSFVCLLGGGRWLPSQESAPLGLSTMSCPVLSDSVLGSRLGTLEEYRAMRHLPSKKGTAKQRVKERVWILGSNLERSVMRELFHGNSFSITG